MLATSRTNATAIYGLPTMDMPLALSIGEEFFRYIKAIPTSTSYTTQLKDPLNSEEIHLQETDINELRTAITNGIAKDFFLNGYRKDRPTSACSFHFKTNAFAKEITHRSHQNTIVATYDTTPTETLDSRITCALVKLILPHAHIAYGIAYQAEDAIFANTYSFGQSLLTLSNNEDPRIWRNQMPVNLERKEPAYLDKIRMVYPCNIITDRHLEQTIESTNLKKWIEGNPYNGKITRIGILSIWDVNQKSVDTVNEACGRAGISLCWKEGKPTVVKRKLP